MLPVDSATAVRAKGERAFWTWETELAAAIFDAVQQLSYYTVAIAGGKPNKPDPYPRPGAKRPEPKTVSLSEFNAFLKG